MSEIEQFSALVGAIYDASLNPSLWTKVLEGICSFVPGAAANIFIQDALAGLANVGFGWGNNPHYEKVYVDRYAKVNPLFPGMLFCQTGEAFCTSDIVPFAQMQRTQFYSEYLQPQGWGEALSAILEKSATSCTVFAIPQYEHLGPIDEGRLNRMRMLVPHVQRAVLINKTLVLQRATAANLERTIEGLAAAVYLVDRNSRIIYANHKGLDLISRTDVMRSSDGCLRAADAVDDRRLHDVLTAAALGDLAAAAKGSVFPLNGGDSERHFAQVLPLTFGERHSVGSTLSAVAAIFVRRVALNLSTFPELVARQFRLTAAETGVIFAMIEVGGVSQVARHLGLSQQTIKTHLKSIFAKTGTKRQAELIKLVAQFGNPIAG